MKPNSAEENIEPPAGVFPEDSWTVAQNRSAELPALEEVVHACSASSANAAVRIGKSNQVDQLYTEFCRRREAGESLDPDFYCQQYPSLKSSLVRVIKAHLFLEEHSHLYDENPPIQFPEQQQSFLGFQLLLELGRGSFARVFLATEPKLGDRQVAVKIAFQGGSEAEILGRIRHPNIVPVYSVQEDVTTGLTAVCMPYLGSATLCDVLDKRAASGSSMLKAQIILDAAGELSFPLDSSSVSHPINPILKKGTYLDGIRWMGAQIADALEYLHQRGICHRDLKPSNVLLSPEGIPMLLDFNLSTDPREVNQRLGGTLPYMAPEQLRSMDERSELPFSILDARSDLYALGVILYQLLTGEHPFGTLSLKYSTAELRQHLLEQQQARRVNVRAANPSVDPTIAHLIERCLANDPSDRPQTAIEVATILRKDLAHATLAHRWFLHHPQLLLTMTLLLLTLAGTGISVLYARAPYDERQFQTGFELYQQGQYQKAVEQFNLALEANPTSATILFGRGRTYQQMGKTDKNYYHRALADYQAAEQFASDGKHLLCMGECFNHLGFHDTALVYYQSAIRNSGCATAELFNNLGYSCLKLNHREKAQEYLDWAIRLDHQLQAASYNRAVLALLKLQENLHLLDPGAIEFAKMKDLDKKEKALLHTLQGGIIDIEKALELGPDSADLHYHAACLYMGALRFDRVPVSRVFDHLHRAVRLGYNAKNLQKDYMFESLWNHSEFRTLVTISQPASSFLISRRIVDSFKDRSD